MVWQENVTSIVMVTTLVDGEQVRESVRISVCRKEHHYCKGGQISTTVSTCSTS